MRFFTKTVGVILIFFTGSALAGDMPDKMVQDAAKEIQDLLKQNHAAYSEDHKKLYAMVHEKVLPYFDFGAMSKLVLATNWKAANESQRDRFTIAFRDLLVRTYATAFLKYTDDKIVFLPFHGKPGDKKVTVDAEIRPASGGPAIPMSYRFYFNKQGQWKVYDVSIDGVSLVINYRSVYAEKIQKEGLDALIASIEKEDPNGELPSSKAAAANKS
ncbi:MAG: ABC transporter substrate-binding protein [Gammaproteobacteria bacterium]|nr:ABC transporter substrate-binding protein [Gammaproteobacteria bacterium]